MSIQFEWQAGRDDGHWETIAKSQRGPVRRWIRRLPWWAWLLVALVVGGLATVGYVTVRQRYQEAQRQIEFQIQTVIDLEARAFAARDADLFIEQQDRAQPEWLQLQGRRIQPDCATARRTIGPRDRTVPALCAPVLPAKVQSVDLKGDVAWVEVIESLPPDPARGTVGQDVRRVRFYRQTDLGWKHTAPAGVFWRTAIRVDYGGLYVLYHRRDQPYVEHLEETVTAAVVDVCEILTCSARNVLTVDFSIEPPPYYAPAIELAPGPEGPDKVTLSSPWLSGIPVGEGRDERTAQELAHAVAYVTAARSIQYTSKRTLSPLQRAILDEYATWYAYGREADLVLLRPLIEERGWDAVPDALHLAKEATSLSQFLEQWADMPAGEVEASPERAAAYLGALLNIEREALLLGRKETFLMLQDSGWQGWQERYYWLARANEAFVPSKPVLVRSAQVAGDRARVQLAEPLPSLQGLPPQSLGSTVYLRQEGGGWRHASPLDGYSWTFAPPVDATPTPTAGRSSD